MGVTTWAETTLTASFPPACIREMRGRTCLGARQIEAVDRKIDALVYELYGLTEDDIRMV
jgi:hypothetical protein